VLILVALIFAVDGVKLIKKKQWREFITFGILLGLALLLEIGKDLGFLGPINIIDKLLSPLGRAMLRNN
jgi:hypothetical protein